MSHFGSDYALGVGAVLFASVIWGTTGTAATFAPEVSAAAIGAAAMGLGGLMQALYAGRSIRASLPALADHKAMLLLGGLAVAIYPLAFYASMRLAGVTIGTVTRAYAVARERGAVLRGQHQFVALVVAAADAVLAPLLIARGVQNKVLEAMAMARPVVLTPEAATGIAGANDEHWLISPPDPEDMAADISDLLANPAAAARIGGAARDFVLRQHGWDAMLAPLGPMLGEHAEGCRHAA